MLSKATGKTRVVKPDKPSQNNIPRFEDKPSPPPSKRQKRDEHKEAPSTPPKFQSRPDNMYKFTSNAMDLTSPTRFSASGASPKSQRISNGFRTTSVGSNATPKKLVVRNFRTTTKTNPEEYFKTIWKELQDALEIVLDKDVKTISLEHLYRGVENICRQDEAPRLFKKLQARCMRHITDVADCLIASSESKSDTEVLKSVVESWTTWRRQMVSIRGFWRDPH